MRHMAATARQALMRARAIRSIMILPFPPVREELGGRWRAWLADQQPDQGRPTDQDPVPGEGAEAALRDDADEPFDHPQSDHEGDEEAERDAAAADRAEIVAVL